MAARASNLLYYMTLCAFANGARILGIFPMPVPSHFFIGHSIMKELAIRGHQVSVINPYPRQVPLKNYKDISVEGIDVVFADLKKYLSDPKGRSPIVGIAQAYDLGNALCDYVFSSETVRDLLKSNERFDLIIVEDFLIPSLTVFSVRFKAPFIYVSTIDAFNNDVFCNPAPASYVPHMVTPYTSKMTFLQRFYNLLLTTYDDTYKHLHFYPKQNEILHKHLPDAPHLHHIIYNATLVLLNSHSSVNDPIPHLPNMIQIGGFHIDASTMALSGDLEQFLDDAEEGVVYVSMGSNVRSADLRVDKRNAIIAALGKLRQRVLWKFETDAIADLLPNVRTEKWLPQSAVLAHPNVKVFISHGGLLSNLESVYHGVPIIGIPMFADQKMNVNTAVDKGYAICLPYHELSEKTLSEALNEMLYNSKYKENVVKRSKLLRDQPLKPIDAAIYWVEYAIRTRRLTHFRSAALDLPWYKLYMWDVTVFLSTVIAALCFTIYLVITRILLSISKPGVKKKIQ